MLTMRELEAQAKALAPVLKGFVASAISAMRGDLEKSLTDRIDEFRKEQAKALEAAAIDPNEIVEKLLKAIPPPNVGLPGKDADMEQVKQLIADEFAKIPVPENGKDADPALIKKLVDEAVAELPAPENGKDADPAEVAKLVLAALPAPEPGKSITAEDVRPMLAEMVAALPPPEPGKDADPEAVERLVADAVAKLPAPKDGASVTVEDLAPVIAEQLAAAVAELPKPQDGKSVPVEDVQRMVAEEVAKAMQSLQLPKDGEPGRDAAHIEILPAIDQAKSYPRGTYAKHLGGLWRSYETTSELKGWECIVEGVASLRIEQEGERGFKAVATLSSGVTEEKSISIPTMIYRGVFTPGEYVPGDTATWGGSLWHCDEPTSDKPGEVGSKGWRLAVKKGRDGKDGTNGKDLTKGVPIK